MARSRKPNRKTKTSSSFNKGQVFNTFNKSVLLFCKKLNVLESYACLSMKEKRIMFEFRILIGTPVAVDFQNISSRELKKVGSCIQKKLRTVIIESQGKKYSPFESQILFCLLAMMDCEQIAESRRKELISMFGFDDIEIIKQNVRDRVLTDYLMTPFKAVLSLSNIRSKYYCLTPRTPVIIPEDPRFEIGMSLSIYPAQSENIGINGAYRPAYKLGFPMMDGRVKWWQIAASKLGNHYLGDQVELQVYIQSHALRRLSERLDLLDESTIYYSIWENTSKLKGFEFYKNYILIPYRLHKCKVGYLAANVIDDILVIRTFLFITHSTTPEGDRLKEISGLGREDISYWKIDRLSTFINIDTERYPKLTALFVEAGLEEIFDLKEKEFDIETLQDANLDGLRDYIKQGKEEVEEFV